MKRRRVLWPLSRDRVGDFDCGDCGVDTIDEYYMLANGLWQRVQRAGRRCAMLCIGCVEVRLGRRLHARDFVNAPVNLIEDCGKSPRLLDRLTSLNLAIEVAHG